MIPTSSNEAPANRFGGNGRGGTATRTGLPYLNTQTQAQFLTADPQSAKIIDARVQAGSQSPLTLKLAIAGKQVLWGLNSRNPNWDILLNAFGKDENDWVGKVVGMFLEEDDFSGRVWPRVDPTYTAPSKTKK